MGLRVPKSNTHAAGSGLLAELAALKKDAKKPRHKRDFTRLDFATRGMYFIKLYEHRVFGFAMLWMLR